MITSQRKGQHSQGLLLNFPLFPKIFFSSFTNLNIMCGKIFQNSYTKLLFLLKVFLIQSYKMKAYELIFICWFFLAQKRSFRNLQKEINLYISQIKAEKCTSKSFCLQQIIIFQDKMNRRKRALKAERNSSASFQSVEKPSGFNLLSCIQNQNLYCKLVTITVQMCRDAGVTPHTLEQLQLKLLNAKGLNQDLMLNKRSSQAGKHLQSEELQAYGIESRWISSSQQISFLNKMEKEVEEASKKEKLVWALKKYIKDKKKVLERRLQPSYQLSRKQKFSKKFLNKYHKKGISRAQFYERSLRDILTKMHACEDESYRMMREIKYLKSLWGHTFKNQIEEEYCPIYNVLYDQSEQLIITGGEDGLIKIWSRGTGLLLTSLKGHKQYINKLTITKCNKYILSAGQDCVRFYDIINMRSIGGFMIQAIMDIISIEKENSFDVLFADNKRLFTLDEETMLTHNNHKLSSHDFRIFSFASHIQPETANAIVLATNRKKDVLIGMTSGQVLLFNFSDLTHKLDPIEEYFQASVYELPLKSVIYAHEGQILQLCWHRQYSYFCTGGKKDGCCKIWNASHPENISNPVLIRDIKIPKHKARRKRKNYHCNYIMWNCSNTHMACSFQEEEQEDQEGRGDGDVVIWSLQKREVICEASKEFELGSVRGLDFHPNYPNVLLICESYGKIILVDIFQTAIMNIFEERGFHLNHPSFCLVPTECHFSSDGLTFLVATQYGNISIYGYDIKDFYDRTPTQQFFQSDFDHFQIDAQSMKPILNSSLKFDINQLERGMIKNIRMGQYSHASSVNAQQFKKFIEKINRANQINHQNFSFIRENDFLNLRENILDYERSFEVYHSEIQEMEHKRLGLLYQQQENKNKRLQQIIQEKSNRLKQLQQNQQIRASQTLKVEKLPKTRNSRLRRLNRTRNRHLSPTNYAQELEQDQKQEQGFEESYKVENEGEEYQENNSEDMLAEEGLQQEESEELSQLIDPRKRRLRNQTHSRRNDFQKQTNLRRRSEQHSEIIQQYSKVRKRVHHEKDDLFEDDLCEPIHHESQYKRLFKQKFSIQEDQYCQQCRLRTSNVMCLLCFGKKLCESCMRSFGKNFAGNFTCFECIYRNNQAREKKNHKSDQKYRIWNRNIFIPQIGDEVAYFFQGYEQFLYDKVEILNKKQIYENPEFLLLPHQKYEELRNPIKCRVKETTYIIPLEQESTPAAFQKRGVRGRLAPTTEDILTLIKMQSPKKQEFFLYFIPGYQFLIKWEIYLDIVKNDRHKKVAIFDIYALKDQEVEVQVMRVEPFKTRYPESIWKNIVVDKTQNINLRRKKEKNQDTFVNIWNLKGAVDEEAYIFQTNFAIEKKKQYEKRIFEVRDISSETWNIFKDFVSPEMYPDYYQNIGVGICLKIILKRLQYNYYKSQQSFVKDINHIHDNSIKYNGEGSFITNLAEKLKNHILFNQKIQDQSMIVLIPQHSIFPEKKITQLKKNQCFCFNQKEQFQDSMSEQLNNSMPEKKKGVRKRRLRKIDDEEFKQDEFNNDDDEGGHFFSPQQRRTTKNHVKQQKFPHTSQISSRITRNRKKQ